MAHKSAFSCFAQKIAHHSGGAAAFGIACAAIVIWAIVGPLFSFSDTWQLVINTGTTIVTFLMVFLIQNTQNRDSAAMQLKLNELLRATEGAHVGLINLEEMNEEELRALKDKYLSLAQAAHERLKKGKPDKGTPEITLT